MGDQQDLKDASQQHGFFRRGHAGIVSGRQQGLDGLPALLGGQAGLHVVDISDPAHPFLVSTHDTKKRADAVRVFSPKRCSRNP